MSNSTDSTGAPAGKPCPTNASSTPWSGRRRGPRWVADGNYSAVRELLWGRATHVVWLNFGRWTVFSRVLRRTLARGLLRTRLSHGNRESLRMAFCSRDSILLWSWTTFAGNRRKYTGLREDPRFAHLRWVEVGEPGRVGEVIERLVEAVLAQSQ
ncbi:hypothetical protein ACHMXJ_08455 [Pseudomonas aeruginosa]|uniref:hypothetical protein n=1 Tax=Pseudomonas aeruginosa TaxID=287 RepID=UPI00379052F8